MIEINGVNYYKYELHTHTIEGSRCSKIAAKDLVDYYKENDYDGICISDHFTGSTTVPEATPWDERIDMFHKGFEEAKKEGDKVGVSVFFSLEYSFHGTDFLMMMDNSFEWLHENKDFIDWDPNQIFKKFRADGGFVSQAHPFMEASYINHVRLFPRSIDAVEVINGSKSDWMNKMAKQYAENYALLKTAGTDTHRDHQENLTAVLTTKKCETIGELVEEIKAGRTKVYSVRNGLSFN